MATLRKFTTKIISKDTNTVQREMILEYKDRNAAMRGMRQDQSRIHGYSKSQFYFVIKVATALEVARENERFQEIENY